MLNQMHSRIGKQILTLFLTLFIHISPLLWRGAGGEVQAQTYQWAHGFGGPNSDSNGNSIATDAQGYVYVTGTFGDSIDFDPGAGTATLYPTAGGEPTVFITKYDSSGGYLWARSLNQSFGDCIAEKIVVNNTGIYLTGHFFLSIDFDPGPGTAILNSIGGWSGDEDIFIAHYDLNGNYLWAKSMGGIGEDEALGMAVDNNGNSYITGYFKDTADFDPDIGVASLIADTLQDIFFAKYDSNGNYLWAHDLCDGNGSFGNGIDICYDENTNQIFIVGYYIGYIDFDRGAGSFLLTSSSFTDWDGYIAKYDSSGVFAWAGIISGAFISEIKISNASSGDITITGSFRGTSDFDMGLGSFVLSTSAFFDSDFFFASYDKNGNLKMVKQIGNANTNEIGRSLEVNTNSFLIICGTYTGLTDFDPNTGIANIAPAGSGNLKDIFFACYDSIGGYNWAEGIGGIYNDEPNAIAIDANGNQYLTGYFNSVVDFDPSNNTTVISAATPNNTIFIAKYQNISTGIFNQFENNTPALIVYPNPAKDKITIGNLPAQAEELTITNSMRTIVWQQQLANQTEVQLHTAHLAPGLYAVSVKTKKDVLVKKFIMVE